VRLTCDAQVRTVRKYYWIFVHTRRLFTCIFWLPTRLPSQLHANWPYLYLHPVVPLLEALSDRLYSPEEATATTNLCPLLLLHPSSQKIDIYAESFKRGLPSWILHLSVSLCKILIRWPPIIHSYPYPSHSSKNQHQDASFKFIPSVVLPVWLSVIPYPGICSICFYISTRLSMTSIKCFVEQSGEEFTQQSINT
jgi:hypothetical protein